MNEFGLLFIFFYFFIVVFILVSGDLLCILSSELHRIVTDSIAYKI